MDSTLKKDPVDAAAEGLDPDAIDTGAPIAQLQSFETPVRPGFLGRLRGRIDRRRFAGDATTFVWTAPWVLLRELLEMVFSSGSGRDAAKAPGHTGRAEDEGKYREAPAEKDPEPGDTATSDDH